MAITDNYIMHKIEWADKRCTLQGQPFTKTQKEYLKFAFADLVTKDSDKIIEPLKIKSNESSRCICKQGN
jgi:hypothetical protein